MTPDGMSGTHSGEMLRKVYFLKRPGGARVSFCIVERTRLAHGKFSNQNFKSEIVDSINAALRSREIELVDADFQLSAIVRKLNQESAKREQGVYVATAANLKHLETYWEAEYKHRDLVDRESARNRLKRAIDLIGTHPLLSRRDELQAALSILDPRRQRAAAAALNQMRRYFGIKDRIALKKKTRPKFHYLRESEVNEVLPHIEKPIHRAWAEVLFSCGVRIGESEALTEDSLNARRVIFIETQIDRKGIDRATKTRRTRKTVLLPRAVNAYATWVAGKHLPEDAETARAVFSDILAGACRAAFPEKPDKWVTPHDLRHSFAVHMLTQHSTSITMLAKMLGNSVAVCEEYYINFIPEDEDLTTVLERTKTQS